MSDMLVANVPAAAAVIVTVGLFLRHIAEQRNKDRDLWANHLSSSVRALTELTDIIKTLRDDIRFSR